MSNRLENIPNCQCQQENRKRKWQLKNFFANFTNMDTVSLDSPARSFTQRRHVTPSSASPRTAPTGTPASASSLCSMGCASLGQIVPSSMFPQKMKSQRLSRRLKMRFLIWKKNLPLKEIHLDLQSSLNDIKDKLIANKEVNTKET